MIVYFADRQLNILGQASTKLPRGLTLIDDKRTEEVETGVSVFECIIPYTDEDRLMIEQYAEVGNYILLKDDNEDKLYTIIESESDSKNQEVYIYVEDAGMDLLNEIVGPYEADKAYPISHYINKYAADAGFVIGINEVTNLSRKLSWDGESTATERLASVATQFDGCEISYSFEIDGLHVVKKYINIYKERGQDIGIELRLNRDIDRIITKKSIANLATALQCTGGTPDDDNLDDDIEPQPITLKGYKYDDGDFYVDSDGILKSREALKRWSRFLWKTDDSQKSGGHIVKQYSYDTLSQATLCSLGITQLKKVREMEVNYEVDISRLPDNVKIGDRINIVDDAGELYVSARILKLETSEANQEHKATIGEYLIRTSGISDKVAELAAQFAKTTQSATRALVITNNALALADEAQAQADAAATSAANAQSVADEAAAVANTAQTSAQNAQTAADNAQNAVGAVAQNVEALEAAVTNAQAAADNANLAAETAQAEADEATKAAEEAKVAAEEAKANVESVQGKANEALTKANAAQSEAETAKANAAAAQETADTAKADAAQAHADIAALGGELDTLSSTMEADYTRKTEFTETTANLQSQITQNAAQITSTVSKLATVDETANSAQEQAQAAQNAADAAQEQADQATADAKAAQTAADNAATAAATAQSEADTAKAAAATAQGVADKAKADLEAAQADLATVTSRVDATEEDIATAQEAVEAAQTAADKAQADAEAAATNAAEAQATADTAVSDAANAQTAANNAASQAALAQQAANEAKGNASAAQARAEEAVAAAAEAQETADTAVANAANAQSKADAAAQAAADAQSAADDADAKAAQAAADLATAKQNLADVTSRVDATEEEVAAAQAAVTTAQNAADKAKEEAEAAQATADTAKANAATAQTAADNAKTAADNAQAAADEAQKAADDAQAAVDALAVRVTSAETKITQNSEQIAFMAKKTEVAEMLGGYSTKEETEAAIKLESDSIKSTVSSTYATKTEVEAIEVGGRNLVICKELVPCYNYYTLSIGEQYKTISGQNFTYYFEIGNLRGNLVPGKVYTISNKSITTTSDYENRVQVRVWDFATSTSHSWHSLISGESLTFTIPAEIDVANTGLLIYPGGGEAFDFTIEELKLEEGNKATDWTPAPEDVDGAIDAAQTTADDATEAATIANERITTAESLIQQLSNCISMLVTDENGESLMTQTENGWTFSMKETAEAVSSLTSLLETLQQETGSTQATVDTLRQAVSDHGETLEYVTVTTYEDEPCVELGESDSDFKLLTTNTRIMFRHGSNVPTLINTNGIVTQNIEVKGNIVQGGYAQLNTADGGWGLLWIGVGS